MPTLIACLSTGKGTWSEVNRVMQSQPWSKIFLITNQFGMEKFTRTENAEMLLVNENMEINQMIDAIKKSMSGKISDFEVALNLASGSGKEHMAMLEAVLELGLNFRIVTINSSGQLEVLGLNR